MTLNCDLHATTTAYRGASTIVSVFGEIDLATAPRLAVELRDLACAGTDRMIIDLSGVAFLDAAGLRVLVALHEYLQLGQRRLDVICPSAFQRRLLAITGLDDELNIHTDLEQALAMTVRGRDVRHRETRGTRWR